MFRAVTGERPQMWGPSIIGYGTHHYRYESGREGDAPLVAFSPRKQSLTIYLVDRFDERDRLLAKLGPHSTGKVCLYLRSLDDIDRAVLKAIVAASLRVAQERARAPIQGSPKAGRGPRRRPGDR